MRPALLPGDYLISIRTDAPSLSDIVAFEHPYRSGFFLVKRVIGLPGEHIEIRSGRLLVDGVPRDPAPGEAMEAGTWTIGEHEVFVLGDARLVSRDDSRSLGLIKVSGLYRVIWRYWPLRSTGRPAHASQ